MSLIVFNSSMPRSGSELLQGILEQHPQIKASTTSPLLEYVYGAARNLETDEAKSQPDSERIFSEFLRGGVEAYVSAQCDEGQDIYLDKSRGWVYYWGLMRQVLGYEPKMVCMVRDIADVCASMEMLYRGSLSVGEEPLEGVTVEDRVGNWLTSTPIGLAVRRLLNAQSCGYPFRAIRYADLCDKPDIVLPEILKYLEVEPFEFDLTNIQKAASEEERVFGPSGIHSLRTSLERSSVSADEVFGKQFADELRKQNAAYQQTFGFGGVS